MKIDPEKEKAFNEYLDEILPADPRKPHPFRAFKYAEIVLHPELGPGIITGYRIPDMEREFEGLGVQFVRMGVMGVHRVFTPEECRVLRSTGICFDVKLHGGMTLEDVLASHGLT